MFATTGLCRTAAITNPGRSRPKSGNCSSHRTLIPPLITTNCGGLCPGSLFSCTLGCSISVLRSSSLRLPALPKFGRTRTRFGQFRAGVGCFWDKFRRNWSVSGQIWTKSGQHCPMPGEVGRHLVDSRTIWSFLGLCWSFLVEFGR